MRDAATGSARQHLGNAWPRRRRGLVGLYQKHNAANQAQRVERTRRVDAPRNQHERRRRNRRRHGSGQQRQPLQQGSVRRFRLKRLLFRRARNRQVDARAPCRSRGGSSRSRIDTGADVPLAPGAMVGSGGDLNRNAAVLLHAEHEALSRCNSHEESCHQAEPGGQAMKGRGQHSRDRKWIGCRSASAVGPGCSGR